MNIRKKHVHLKQITYSCWRVWNLQQYMCKVAKLSDTSTLITLEKNMVIWNTAQWPEGYEKQKGDREANQVEPLQWEGGGAPFGRCDWASFQHLTQSQPTRSIRKQKVWECGWRKRKIWERMRCQAEINRHRKSEKCNTETASQLTEGFRDPSSISARHTSLRGSPGSLQQNTFTLWVWFSEFLLLTITAF